MEDIIKRFEKLVIEKEKYKKIIIDLYYELGLEGAKNDIGKIYMVEEFKIKDLK